MARRPQEGGGSGNTPAQQDEADIIDEVGAVRDESGTLFAAEGNVRKLGAVDPDSVRMNRRLDAVVGKKRGNVPSVPFGTDDVLVIYDTLRRVWPGDPFFINVKRTTGTRVQEMIKSGPRSGAELYEAIKAIHGQYGEAEYEVVITDAGSSEWRGKGRIAMPDTRLPLQGQPMPQQPPPQQPQQQVAAPPQQSPAGFDANSMLQMFQTFQQMVQQIQGAQPQPQHPVATPSSNFAEMQQMFQMFQQMVQQAQPRGQSQSPVVATASLAEQTQQMFQMFQQMLQQAQTSAQPRGQSQSPANPAEQMQQMFQMFQQMLQMTQPAPATPSRGGSQPQQQQPPMNPMAMMGPTTPAPSGMMWGWMPGFGFALVPANGAGGGPGPGQGPYRGPYRPPPSGGGEPHQGPTAPPPRPLTAAEQFREAVGVIRTAVHAVEEFNEMVPGRQAGEPAEVARDDDDSPVVIKDMGKFKGSFNKDDGAMRWGETLAMAVPDILKWSAEQVDKIQKARREQQAQQQPRPQQLPPGYVEVTPGYQPPPGYVAVPVDPSQVPQQVLAPPPTQMPPPIQPQERRTWGIPTIPDPERDGER